MESKNFCTGTVDIVSVQARYNTTETSFIIQANMKQSGNVKALYSKQPYRHY